MTGIGPLFGILVQERAPGSLEVNYVSWLQDAGGFAALFLLIWILVEVARSLFLRPTVAGATRSRPVPLTFPVLVLGALALLVYVIGFFLFFLNRSSSGSATPLAAGAAAKPASGLSLYADICYAIGGALALIALALRPISEVIHWRWRRIWALTRLSFHEAIRRRVLWVFLVFLVIFLFPPKWFVLIKPENEIRTSVQVIYWTMTPLLLVVTSLLAAFSLPTDLRNQTIHTVVTKPVQRFELVLGRFLGYMGLATIVLLVLTSISLGLIGITTISPEARSESLKARDVVYGDLSFSARNNPDFRGESVGREWEYRKYIAGGASSLQRAIWTFPDLSDLGTEGRVSVPCEFAFDIFRTTKGEEGKGVFITFKFYTWAWKNLSDLGGVAPNEKKYAAAAARLTNRAAQPDGSPTGGAAWQAVNELAGEYGYYEIDNKEISDYHTLSVQLPPALIKKAQESKPPTVNLPGGAKKTLPKLMVEVKCESRTQFLGVARYDMYLLRDEGNFYLNFYKGAFGLWLRLALMVGIAVTCSTLLSGVIAWLATMFLFGLGLGPVQDFIRDLATGKNIGGGPMESLVRLAQHQNVVNQLDLTPGTRVALFTDQIFQWGMRRVLDVIPDVDRLDWSNYVAEGFNISWWHDSAGQPGLLLNLVFVAGYLLPWALLAYYLIKTREVAA